MNKIPISIIFVLKTGALCWEADDNGAKLRNLFLIFKTPRIKIWSLVIKTILYIFFTIVEKTRPVEMTRIAS